MNRKFVFFAIFAYQIFASFAPALLFSKIFDNVNRFSWIFIVIALALFFLPSFLLASKFIDQSKSSSSFLSALFGNLFFFPLNLYSIFSSDHEPFIFAPFKNDCFISLSDFLDPKNFPKSNHD